MTLALSINHGSPIGGQPIEATGEAFGENAGTIAINGLACTVTAWASDGVAFTTPPRRTADGIYIRTPDTVQVVITLADGVTTYSASYSYTVTVYDQALAQIATALAQLSRAEGDNFTVTPGQIIGFQTQEIMSGSEWPMFDFYGGELSIGEHGSDNPYGFDTGTFPFYMRGSMPLSAPANWDMELRALMRDMHRAIRKARETDQAALEIRVDSIVGGKDSPDEGSLGTVILQGTIIAKHINCNMDTWTQGE